MAVSTADPAVGRTRPTPTTWHRDLLAAAGRWPWLARLDEQVAAVVLPAYDKVRGNLLVELMHGGRWMGHALHPALSDLPIGFWAGTAVLDAVGRDGRHDAAAATLTGAGLLAAGATAATGVADWTVSDGEDRRAGLLHGLLNGAATVLQGASLAARASGHRGTARALSMAGMGTVTAAAFLGGHLVLGRGAMVNRTAPNSGPNRWVKALADAELPAATPAGVEVDGRKVMLLRPEPSGEVYAIDDLCSHAGALLSRGEVEGCVVSCPLHASLFDVRDGHIVRGPAHHAQPALPTRVRNGWIEVRGSMPRARRARTTTQTT
jgi:nitrite reductase/ring-hydroxylating ferredoxin subunit/uncharacterized membrane protein